jgi:hypothetical protein
MEIALGALGLTAMSHPALPYSRRRKLKQPWSAETLYAKQLTARVWRYVLHNAFEADKLTKSAGLAVLLASDINNSIGESSEGLIAGWGEWGRHQRKNPPIATKTRAALVRRGK